MKMFFGGSAAFTAATLLAASVLFYAKPLFAEVTTTSSQNPTSIQQQKEEITGEIAPPQTEQSEVLRASESAVNAPPTVAAPARTSSPGEESSGSVLPAKIVEAPAAAASAITAPQAYIATAYNLAGRTASGLRVAKGIIAADPRVLPLGTRVRLEAGPYSGEYIVADTGSAVRGRKIDVWVPSYREACRFGRRNIKLSVLSYGGKRAKIRRQK